MKHIHLNGAAVRNSGHYVDAGHTVPVGNDPDHIDAKRAKEMVDTGRATPADGKPAA